MNNHIYPGATIHGDSLKGAALNAPQIPRVTVLQDRLSTLVSEINDIYVRQGYFLDRVRGSIPTPVEKGVADQQPNCVLASMTQSLDALERVIANLRSYTNDMEGIA